MITITGKQARKQAIFICKPRLRFLQLRLADVGVGRQGLCPKGIFLISCFKYPEYTDLSTRYIQKSSRTNLTDERTAFLSLLALEGVSLSR